MEAAILAAISTILGVIETVLPVIGTSTAATGVVASLVTMLEKWVPIVIAELPSATTLFDSIKGAIAALSANPAATSDQLATLQQLDAQVDTAFEAIATDPAITPPAAS